jgi:hypothetical protein
VDDGVSSHCINQQTEAVTLDLRRLMVNDSKGWFTKDTKVDLLLSVRLAGKTAGSTDDKTLSLPRAYAASLESGDGKLYSAGIEESVVNSYALKGDKDQVTSLHVDISLVNEHGATVLAQVALSLLDLTKSLPIPAGPFAEALKYADQFATKILGTLTANPDLTKDLVKTGSFQLNFSRSGNECGPGGAVGKPEKTGTIALVEISSKPDAARGIPDMNHSENYCFRIGKGAVFSLQYQGRAVNGTCPVGEGGWIDLHEPHIALVLNADPVPAPGTKGIALRSDESRARCAATHIKKC